MWNKIKKFFQKLFGDDVKTNPVTNNTVAWAPPPAQQPLPVIDVILVSPTDAPGQVIPEPTQNERDQNWLEWRAYQEELVRTGKFPTVPAAPRTTVIPDTFLTTPEGNTAQAHLDYLASLKDTTSKPDLVEPPRVEIDVPYLPGVPPFRFTGYTPCEQEFNTLAIKQGMKKAFTYMVNHWNELGTPFREQAEGQGIDSTNQSRIINHFSNQGKYFS